MEKLHLEPTNEVYKAIASAVGYTGRKLMSVVATDSVEMTGTYWSGGSRSTYHGIDVREYPNIRAAQLPQFDPPQFGGPAKPPIVKLADGLAVVELSIYCGKEMGPRVMLHTENFTAMLPPAEIDLTEPEAMVLLATATLKSFARRDETARHGINADAYETAVESLKGKGLLRKNAAITADGRNAVDAYRAQHDGFPRYL